MALNRKAFESKFLYDANMFALTVDPNSEDYSVGKKVSDFLKPYTLEYHEYYSWMFVMTVNLIEFDTPVMLPIAKNSEYGEAFGCVMVHPGLYFDPVECEKAIKEVINANHTVINNFRSISVVAVISLCFNIYNYFA